MPLSIFLICFGFSIEIINPYRLKSYNRYGSSGLFIGITGKNIKKESSIGPTPGKLFSPSTP